MGEDSTKRSEFRDKRRLLRQIQSHINQTALNAGSVTELAGAVDVIHHSEKALPAWNFVTPRQNTAWVPAHDIQHGIERLKSFNREPRFIFNEALFPPQFSASILRLGMAVECELPIMAWSLDDEADAKKPAKPVLPAGITITPVTTSEGGGTWWYVWRSAYYNVITSTATQSTIGMDLYRIAQGTQLDTVMYRQGFAIGVSRMTLFPENHSAQIVATALLREAESEALVSLFQRYAMAEAVARGCTMIFSDSQTELERTVYRKNGFVDCGSMVCYGETDNTLEEDNDDTVEQPVFTLR